mgnify:CR=1 FL=1
MTAQNRKHEFEQLVGAYTDDLYRFGIWLARDREVANDLVQETMLRAWRSLDSLKDVRAVKAWLFTTLRRENARRFERKQLPLVDIDDYNPGDDASVGPDGELENNDMRKAMARLPLKYREPLVLQALLGHSIAEIAEQLELSESATMTRVFRARQKLKAQLEASALPLKTEIPAAAAAAA